MKFRDKMLFIAIVVAFLVSELFLLAGCSTLQAKSLYVPTLTETYRHDLVLKINGDKFVGTGVAKLASSYKIEVIPEGKIDRIIWRTCNREEVVDKPGGTWWGYQGYSFDLKPAIGLEDVTACGLQVIVLEEKKRRNGFAFVDFQDARSEMDVEAIMTCNGVTRESKGVEVCQSASGLYQQIKFNTKVVQAGVSGQCNVMKPFDGDESFYRFTMPTGECSYYFVAQEKAVNGKRRIFRLSTLGYSDVLPNLEK